MPPSTQPNDSGALWARMREAEQALAAADRAIAVHEATCAGRYRLILWLQGITLAGVLFLLGAAAAGNPVLQAIRNIGGH